MSLKALEYEMDLEGGNKIGFVMDPNGFLVLKVIDTDGNVFAKLVMSAIDVGKFNNITRAMGDLRRSDLVVVPPKVVTPPAQPEPETPDA